MKLFFKFGSVVQISFKDISYLELWQPFSFKDISYLELWQPFGLAQLNHLYNFNRRHYGNSVVQKSTAKVMVGRSVYLSTFSWASLNKGLTSTSRTYFHL